MISELHPETKQHCPDRDTLVDFLLGKLPVPELESCEIHLSKCPPCADTIRSLDQSDTMTELTRDAFIGLTPDCDLNQSLPETSTQNSIDEVAVKDLVGKMREWALDSKTGLKPGVQTERDLNDRATEVQCLLGQNESEQDGDSTIGRLAHYRIERLLGAGSTGVVYLATDENLNRPVALKVLRPSLGQAARERFLAEAQAAAAIDHPNVVSIYHVGTEGKLAYIAMNWSQGETLEQCLGRDDALPSDQVRELGRQISQGLSAAHDLGLIHRDIKPANIWIHSDSRRYTILDFGLVRTTDEDPQMTCTGMIAGTPSYMSPEQSRGAKLDCRSDLFSLGCLLYQSLTGKLPFSSNNVLATLQSIQRDVPTQPCELDPNVPNDLSDLVMCLLEKSSIKRPPTASSVANAISSDRANWEFESSYNSAGKSNTPKLNAFSKAASTTKPPQTSSLFGGWVGWITGLAICGLFGFGVYFAPQIIRIATNHGQLVIKTNDPNIKIEILSGGERVEIVDLTTKQSLSIVAGDYEIRPVSDDNSISIDKETITMSRGGKEIVSVSRGKSVASSFEREPYAPSAIRTTRDTKAFVLKTYKLDANDVLAVFIEGVLGEFESNPPIHMRKKTSELPPAVGYPAVVLPDGSLSLPLIKSIAVTGKTLTEAEEAIRNAYQGGEDPIIKKEGRVLATLLFRRGQNDASQTYELGKEQPDEQVLVKTEPKATTAAGEPVNQKEYRVDGGDVLGIHIDGVLGDFETGPQTHMPKEGSNLLPSFGSPVQVYGDGTITLPLVKDITVRGKNLREIETDIKTAFRSGDDPILKEGRIMVSLMQPRNRSYPTDEFYKLDGGDILGLHIESVLGEFGVSPEFHMPRPGSDDLPSFGIPVAVLADGSISVPLVDPISVKGKNLKQVLASINAAYKEGDEPILTAQGIILVSLMRKRNESTHGSISDSPTIEILKFMKFELQTQLTKCQGRYGPSHPESITVKEQLVLVTELLKEERQSGGMRQWPSEFIYEFVALKLNLLNATKKHGPKHSKIIQLHSKLKSLEQQGKLQFQKAPIQNESPLNTSKSPND